MSKKLLVFCGGYLIGGQEIVTLNYLKELITLGVQIHCITNAWGNGDFEKRLKDLRIPFTSIKLGFIYPRKPVWTLETIFFLPRAIKEIKKIISVFQPNAFYHTSFRTIYMLQFFLKVKHILHVHENISKTFFNKYILKSINKNTKKFIAVSNVTKDHLILCGIDESKIEVLHNGTEIIPLPQHTLKQKSYKFGLVGQIAPHKGHDLVVEAMALLKQKDVYFNLKVFGQGAQDYIDKLKEKIEEYDLVDYIEWKGFINNIDDIYSNIDILLFPTITLESFGMGIIEAGVRGVPCLATQAGGLAEIIDHNYNGWLFYKKDVSDLVSKIEATMKKNCDLTDIIKNNYNRISAKFDIKKQASQLKSIIFDLHN